MRAVCGCGHVRGVVQLRGPDRVADARGAVAQTNNLVRAIDVRDLVDIALAFRPLYDLHRLVVRDVPPHVTVDAVLRQVAEADAVLALDLSAALAAHPLLLSAGADADGKLIILFQPVRNELDGHRLIVRLDSLLHRDDMHPDPGTSWRHHLGDSAERQLGHQIEERRQLRVLRRQLFVHHHELRDARHKDRQIVHLLMGLLLAADGLQKAVDAEVNAHLLRRPVRHVVHLRELIDRIRNPGLFKGQQEAGLFLRQDSVQHPVLRILCVQRMGKLFGIAVGDDGRKLQDHLLLLLVDWLPILVRPEIVLVDHRIADLPCRHPLFVLRIIADHICTLLFHTSHSDAHMPFHKARGLFSSQDLPRRRRPTASQHCKARGIRHSVRNPTGGAVPPPHSTAKPRASGIQSEESADDVA